MDTTEKKKKVARCAYIKACFMAEELNCFGYKTDCPLYQKSNGMELSEERFNEALDQLINKTYAKYHKIPTS